MSEENETIETNSHAPLSGVRTRFVFTPDNLIDNLDKLGGWSCYGLASDAIQHYFPEVYADEDNPPSVQQEADLAEKIGCKYWEDVIKKYHKEVGYKGSFNPEAVNEF